MPPSTPRFEVVGGQRLPLGGVNGYVHVRGKQGKKRNKFQGISPGKKTLTKTFRHRAGGCHCFRANEGGRRAWACGARRLQKNGAANQLLHAEDDGARHVPWPPVQAAAAGDPEGSSSATLAAAGG